MMLFVVSFTSNAMAAIVSCNPGTYWSGSYCATCTSQYYCEGFSNVNNPKRNYGRVRCPTGYRSGGMGLSVIDQCVLQTSAGRYIATAYSTSQTSCTAGYYCPAALVNYGSTGSRLPCTGATYSGSGASSCTNCPSGYTDNLEDGKTSSSECQIQTDAGTYLAYAYYTIINTCDSGYYCPAALINYGSTGNRIACPAGYTSGGTGLSAIDQCKIQTAGGTYIATPNVTYVTTCTAGYYCPSALVSYGSTGSILPCTGATYSGSGAASCTSCPSIYNANLTNNKTSSSQCQVQTTGGTYIATANASTLTMCTAGYYCPDTLINYGGTGTRNSCPAGYTSGGTGLSTLNQCALQTTAGRYIATANSTTQVICTAGYYCPAALIGYGNIGSIIQCTGATYSATGASICTNCPTDYTANTIAGKTDDSQCQIQTIDGTYISTAGSSTLTTCTAGYYCPSTLINYGVTGGAIECLAGTYSRGGNSTCTACTIGSYNTNNGENSCIACQDGTTTSTTGKTSCDAICSNNNNYDSSWANATWLSGSNTVNNLCSISGCFGGYYVAVDACDAVGTTYWSADGLITRTACDAGLTTIGFGAGADEAGDCGKVFNIGSNQVHLRSQKKTTPALYIQLNGSTYYGNMDTGQKGSIRANYNGIDYSIYDDSI
ncbi:MAG: hypothetical protein JW974_00640 [Alphaproteobacteria bacterium]|nr:hypothetical protein [Alphaproteobacteria bacterium]MBN2675256.1 hypothetical protein [Alphaproteobacteria bacterium]